MANIGYARCSTIAQDLTAQCQALACTGPSTGPPRYPRARPIPARHLTSPSTTSS
jgi:hypothetical protein